MNKTNWFKSLICWLGIHRRYAPFLGGNEPDPVTRYCRWCPSIVHDLSRRNASMRRVYLALHHFFWRTLCPRPDGRLNLALNGWPYNFTGRIAGYFHRKTCSRCANRQPRKQTA